MDTREFYVTFKVNGDISAFYERGIHGDTIPEDAMPITIEQWKLYITNTQLYKKDGDSIREKTQQELDDEAANQPTPDKTPEQMRIEELEAQLALQNTNNTAFIEFVLQTLGVE